MAVVRAQTPPEVIELMESSSEDLSESVSSPPRKKSLKEARVNKTGDNGLLMDYQFDDLSEESSLPDPFRKSPKRAEVAAVNEARRYMKDSFQKCMMEAEEDAGGGMVEEEKQGFPEDEDGHGGVHFANSAKTPAEEKKEELYSPQITGGVSFGHRPHSLTLLIQRMQRPVSSTVAVTKGTH
jgi:hypothetical protein